MKRLLILALTWAAAMAVMAETGVSRELAQHRKATVSNLIYDLSFDLPADKSVPVKGHLQLSFQLSEPGDVTLDFKAPAGALSHVSMPHSVVDEHILLHGMESGTNSVSIDFIAGDQPLNRRDDMLYTLLVPDRARTLFPCMDQPDLKAQYQLTLTLPQGWEAVSNTNVANADTRNGITTLTFAATEPLSTYLFSFVAGKFKKHTYDSNGRHFCCYYRETDPRKTQQLDTICDQVAHALQWQEDYTGVPYPFSKYDFIILPGFQFGGMEHTGATLYNDQRMFLPPNPTPDQQLSRAQLIAHETSHMWFGDLVTMAWFDDVWTKEVFANYYASRIVPQTNPRLGFMREYVASALSQDRTPGRTAIHQELDNLEDAGLIYNEIIYNKAPVVMDKIVELMGEQPFRDGIRQYLHDYAYSNATWDDLIAILDAHTPEDLAAFSREWVYKTGMPKIDIRPVKNGVSIRQNGCWRQSFDIMADTTRLTVNLTDSVTLLPLDFTPTRLQPNIDGRAYGLITLDSASTQWLLDNWHTIAGDIPRLAALMTLNENYRAHTIPHDAWLQSLMRAAQAETDPLIAATTVGYMGLPLDMVDNADETALLALSRSHPRPSIRVSLLRTLIQHAKSPTTLNELYSIWRNQSEPLLAEADYTSLAYRLAGEKLTLPQTSDDILAMQRRRITNPDRLAQFDYIAPATTADSSKAWQKFESLLDPANRRIEPWASKALKLLASHGNARYVLPALEELRRVQRTGDIFFPRNWCSALLSGQRSAEADKAVKTFLDANPDYPQLLKNKILQSLHPFSEL